RGAEKLRRRVAAPQVHQRLGGMLARRELDRPAPLRGGRAAVTRRGAEARRDARSAPPTLPGGRGATRPALRRLGRPRTGGEVARAAGAGDGKAEGETAPVTPIQPRTVPPTPLQEPARFSKAQRETVLAYPSTAS